jgi:hypothetical protein
VIAAEAPSRRDRTRFEPVRRGKVPAKHARAR